MQGGKADMDLIEQLAGALAGRVAAAAPFVVAIRGGRRLCSGILWRPDVVVTSAQMLGDDPKLAVVGNGQQVEATLVGRDPGTNVAVLRLTSSLPAAPLPVMGTCAVGSLALIVGATPTGGPTARLAMIHAVGDAWHSLAGGRIDALIRLDSRLGVDEGGPILASDGGLLGMSTSGPRRRTIVIPTETLNRVIDPLLSEGRIARGWLGVGLQPVMIPDALRPLTGVDAGLMVVSLAPGAPADAAGVLPGDILLDIDGMAVARPRALAGMLGPDRIGQSVALRLLRAGALQTLNAAVAARPAG
jgi:S1-C subfamily serine protease